ncbi:MAG TPA: PQQ-binding-like beta-propeller repeat protein [Verrucomicrobiae bacterium]
MIARKPILVAALAALLILGTPYSPLADDWPQWQGPDRNSISKETGLLKQWPKEGPSLAWKITGLGGGDSAPAIAAGRIYGMANRGEDEVVWAVSEKDGKELWVTKLGPAFKQQAPQGKEGPACTPTVDGELLYVEGLGGDVACLQVKDGKIVWRRSLTSDFGGRAPMWSYRESPLIDGDKLICTPGSDDAMLVALDKLTGKTIWKSQMPSGAGAGAGGPGGPGGGPGVPGSAGGRGGGSAPAVTGTKDPGLFTSEHWGMTTFSRKIPNGKYLAKLYFAETYEGITGAGQRVFSFNVQGKEFKDFDIWAKTGGRNRAYIETVPVEVTDGEFRIVFTRQVENPAINAIEITPQAEAATGAAASAAAIRIKAGLSAPFTDSSGQVWQADTGFEGGMMSQVGGGFGGGPGAGAGGFGGGMGRPGGGPGGRGGGFGGSGAAYSSVIAIDFEGQRQYVQLTARALIGVAASDGKFLWRYDPPANRMGINCSTPLYHDGMVFAASAYGAGGGLVKLSKDANGGVKAEEVYATRKMQNHHGGMILLDGCLYGANGGNEGGFLICLDFNTGKVLWDGRDDSERRAPKGSVALADGRLYYRTEKGTMLLIEPSPKEYIEHGRFEQPDRTRLPAWAHPVVANGRLYVRDQDLLLCYDVKAK